MNDLTVPDLTEGNTSTVTVRPPTVQWLLLTATVFGLLFAANQLRPSLPDYEQLAAWGYMRLVDKVAIEHLDLIDHNGAPVTAERLRGRTQLVFFGFTACPDVCPTTLSLLARVTAALGDRAPEVVLVSVDPERDDLARLKAYVTAFDPDFVALTGSADELARFADLLQVRFEREPLAGGGYTVNHSGHVALIDARGEFAGFFRLPHREPYMVQALDTLL